MTDDKPDPLDLMGALHESVRMARTIRESQAEREAAWVDVRPEPDLSDGTVVLAINERIRPCAYCEKPILPHAGVVAHTPFPRISAVRNYYHPECVDIP